MQTREATVNSTYTFKTRCHCIPLIAPGGKPTFSTAIPGASSVFDFHLPFAHKVVDVVYLVLVESRDSLIGTSA